MELLVDVFGYLSIIIHGLTIIAQSMALGGVLFLIVLVRPMIGSLRHAGRPCACQAQVGVACACQGRAGTARAAEAIARDTVRLAAWSALALVGCEALTLALQGAVLAETVQLPISQTLSANFAIAGMIKIAGGLTIALTLLMRGGRAPALPLLLAGAAVLAGATMTTHAAARMDGRAPLLAVEALHLTGAAIWIGGIPAFVSALARVNDAAAWRAIGRRFSRMSMVGVGCIIASGAFMAWSYVGDLQGFYGTAYGVMVGAKIALFGGLLLLGLGNYLVTERLGRDASTPVLRMKRFAEVEIGVGFSLFFAAASLTSVPPAVDLTQDRVTWHEIVERNRPVWPRMASPDHDALALPALQAQLDAAAAASASAPLAAFVPGSGDLPVRNAADIAWSEYNHHWAGVFVLAIGALALFNQAGARWARHWPLLLLGLAAFLFLRSDPEVWPLGKEGVWESLRDVEVLQHRVFVLITVVFALFEWRVRAGGWRSRWAPLVFPLVCAGGGAALLTHTHAIANIKDQLLIELTHTPLALACIAAGWSRWLELRLDGRAARVAGWAWPWLFVLVGGILLSYREA